MSRAIKFSLCFSLALCVGAACFAQLAVPSTPLTVGDDLPMIQAAPYSNFSDPQCDRDGTVYLRQETTDDRSWDVVKISSDGSAGQVDLAAVPGFGDTHTFVMATAEGGSVHEILRARDENDKGEAPSIYYVQFDADGSFRSRERFKHEFVPSMLLPLPSGDFFAAGVVIKQQSGGNDGEETPLAGIFDSDARLESKLQRASAKSIGRANGGAQSGSETDADAMQQGGFARLGDDGNIYVLLPETNTRVRVYRQTGQFLREMTLQQPFQEGLVTGAWVSGGRLLVAYEGEADNPQDAFTYILYDARSGDLIRAYRPQFMGMVACFQNGQSLTLLVKKYSGQLAITTAELQ